MAALTQGAQRKMQPELLGNYGLAANATVWRGGALKRTAGGFAEPLTATSGVIFGGFAQDDVKGGATAGDDNVNAVLAGIWETPVTGANRGTIGANIFMTNDNDVTTSSTGNAVKIGVAIEWVSGTSNAVMKVRFDATVKQLAA